MRDRESGLRTVPDDTRDARRAGEAGTEGGTLLRRLLLVLFVFGAGGLGAELVLLEHTGSIRQWIPLASLGAGLAACAAVAFRPSPGTVRAFQVVMVVFVLAGLLGVYLHHGSNLEFEREIDPSARGLELFVRVIYGATPLLAPGALVQLGLLGLVYAFRHPALHRRQPHKENR